MDIRSLSTAFTTDKVAESRDFYVQYFGARITFDCGWYVNLEFGDPSKSLQFMSPQAPEHQLASGAGLIYNITVADADKEYERLTTAGFEPVLPLEDHPWGDRGFAILDPNGISLYIYSEREPSEDFKSFYQ